MDTISMKQLEEEMENYIKKMGEELQNELAERRRVGELAKGLTSL